MTLQNTQIIKELSIYYDWKPQTQKGYKTTITDYCNYHQKTMHELIQEAEQEEETINKVNKRTIKKRLMDYIVYQKKQNKKPSTIKISLSRIQKIYTHYDIDLPRIPPLQARQKHEKYNEIPSHKDIKNILLNTTLFNKVVITFLASSGVRISDMCSLKIQDFKKAIEIYSNHHRLIDILAELEKTSELIIPTWQINSKKTNIEYITFTSDENTRLLIQYLHQRILEQEVNDEDALFDKSIRAIASRLQRINDNLGLGLVDGRRFFHAHALRKYFATTLYNQGVEFLTVDFLLGHTLPPIRASYYKSNPQHLKDVYTSHINNFTFISSVEVKRGNITDGELKELEELREYKKETDKRLEQLENLIKSVLE